VTGTARRSLGGPKWSKFQWIVVLLSVLFLVVDSYYVSTGQQRGHAFSKPPWRILLGCILLSGCTIACALEAENDLRARRMSQALIFIHAVLSADFLYYAWNF